MPPTQEPNDTGPKPGGDALRPAIDARLRAIESGQYRRSTERALELFAEFLRHERGVETLDELTVTDCRRYAQFLRDATRGETPAWTDLDISPSTASGPYYENVSAFLGWCVRDERLDTNPAHPDRATEPLPTSTEQPARQFWDADAREAIIRAVEKRAHGALDAADDPHAREVRQAYRDRALVHVVALTGARGAEIVRDPDDEHRDGIRWHDVDLDERVLEVLGKARSRETAPLPGESAARLESWRDVLQPASEDWPVYPTFHPPTISAHLREKVGDDAVETALDEGSIWDAADELGVAPPSMTVGGARDLMQRLCDEEGIAIDGEYLKPHGGRRGIGGEVYRESAELAQNLLRHKSPEVTSESYQDIETAETREAVEDVLDGD